MDVIEENIKTMKDGLELLEILAKTEDDVENGRIQPINKTFDDLRLILQAE